MRRSTHLVTVQSALDELADLLKHCCLVCSGPKHLVKGEGVLLRGLARQAAWHSDVNGTALQLPCSTAAAQHRSARHTSMLMVHWCPNRLVIAQLMGSSHQWHLMLPLVANGKRLNLWQKMADNMLFAVNKIGNILFASPCSARPTHRCWGTQWPCRGCCWSQKPSQPH